MTKSSFNYQILSSAYIVLVYNLCPRMRGINYILFTQRDNNGVKTIINTPVNPKYLTTIRIRMSFIARYVYTY